MIQIKYEDNHFQHQHEGLSPVQTPQKRQEKRICQNRNESTKDKNRHFICKKFRKSVWTKQEDELLKTKVQEKGPIQWACIASFLPNRSGKQCRERWHNHLREGVTKKAWDLNEFWILALCVRAFGKRWSAISQFIPGRSDNTIKNQWNCKMKPYKHHFESKIDKILSNPESWSSLSPDQQMLIKKISKRRPQQTFYENKEVLKFLQSYSTMLERGLSEYYEIKDELCMLSTSQKSEVSRKQEEMEQPGDLSVAISAGDCVFYESQQENPIVPKCLFS